MDVRGDDGRDFGLVTICAVSGTGDSWKVVRNADRLENEQ